MRLLRFTCPTIFLVAIAGLAAACGDEIHAFEFVNESRADIILDYQIRVEDSTEALYNRKYEIPTGQSIDTAYDRSLEGDRGQSIFRKGRVLVVRAETQNGEVLMDETFTYDEVKDMKFRIVISERP